MTEKNIMGIPSRERARRKGAGAGNIKKSNALYGLVFL